MTTNHKISRRCHSSVREPWIEIESLESGQKYPSFQLFVTGDLQDTPISQCFGMLLSQTQLRKLLPNTKQRLQNVHGTGFQVMRWRTWGDNMNNLPGKKDHTKSIPLNSYCNGTRCSDLPTVKWFRCSQLLIPTTKPPAAKLRLNTYEALVRRFALKHGSNCAALLWIYIHYIFYTEL